MRLIDADELKKDIYIMTDCNGYVHRVVSKFSIDDALTVERPKGEWLRMSNLSEEKDDRYECSNCGNVVHYKRKMDLYTFNGWCGRCGSNNRRKMEYEE